LIDLQLVRMGGLEVVRQLKVSDRTRPIPIVVFTGSQNVAEILESYRLGANSYVVKPTDPEQYAQAVGDIAYYWLVVNRAFNSPVIRPVGR
jgi:two-component system response regulator